MAAPLSGRGPGGASRPTAPAKAPARAPTRRAAPKPVDPYANPQRYINRAVMRLGPALTDQQIQANAQGQLSPLVQQLTDSLNRQAQSGTAAIGGYTSSLAKALGGYQQNAANIYGGAEQSQAASDAALSQRLTGGGTADANALGAKLASINAPGATNAAVGAATQDATGSGNALYATGSASLANLIASGAAEQSYAGKLPGLAGLAGEQQLGSLQGSIASQLADKTAGIEAQAPGIVSGLQGQRSDLLNRREALRGDLSSFFDTRAKQAAALAQEKAVFGLNKQKANVDTNYKAATLTEKQRHDQATEATAAKKAAATAKTAAAKAAKVTAPKPLSATALKNLSQKAHDFYNGIPQHQHYNTTKQAWEGVPGTGANAVPWGSAISQLVALGATKQQAQTLLEAQGWKPGEGGRPMSAAQKKTSAAVKAGLGVPKTTGPFAGLGG